MQPCRCQMMAAWMKMVTLQTDRSKSILLFCDIKVATHGKALDMEGCMGEGGELCATFHKTDMIGKGSCLALVQLQIG